MVVLALDTTTRQGSVALTRDGVAIAIEAGDPVIPYAERLPGDLVRLLDGQHLRISDVDLFAVAAGPGSFTGLRIGIATMQGLALANAKPLAGVSALDAIHSAAGHAAGEIAVWMDAGRGQVFSAIYGNGAVVEPALVDAPREILARWGRERVHLPLFAGDGALVYRDLVDAAYPAAQIIEPLPPLAPSVARLAEIQVGRTGAPDPAAIRPIYIRRSDVELARDRAAAAKP
jgi:tRNA threonylcarbamoyladenosine biosynthesis protein TsaB